MEAALPLEPIEFDLSVEDTGDVSNMTAEQYLSWVRYQAEKLPNWKRVEVAPQVSNRQSKYMPQVVNIVSCPVDCLPSDEWQRELLYAFSELRQTLESLCQEEGSKDRKVAVPQMKDHAAWHRFCFAAEDDIDSPALPKDDTTAVQTAVLMDDLSSSDYSDVAGSGDVGATGTVVGEVEVSDTQRAVNKRKRDLEYQLGIAFVKNPNPNTSSCVNDNITGSKMGANPSAGGEDADYTTGNSHCAENDDSEPMNGEEEEEVEGEDVLGEDVNEAIEGVWAQAAAAAQWTGAINVEPTTSILLQFDQVLTQRLLALQIDWLEERSLTPARGRWLYGLLARLEKPLYRETAASIRQLYRRCCALRLELSQTSASFCNSSSSCSSETEDPTAAVTFQNQLAALNVLISIAGSYFGQGEEYDAFNRALMQETAEYDAAMENEENEDGDGLGEGGEESEEEGEYGDFEEVEEEEEEGNWEGEEGVAEEGGEPAVKANVPLSEWVPVRMVVASSSSSKPVNSSAGVRAGGNSGQQAMELEDGEEVEADAMDCCDGDRSSKKVKSDA